VADVVHAATSALSATMPDWIRLETSVAPDIGLARIDREELEQVLINLGTNAAQAIGERTGSVAIEVDVEQGAADGAPRWIRLTVRDDGPGVPEHLRERVFEPFFTTKPVGQGTGLGLAMVHSIVTSHGGSIELASTPGAGAAFTIRLEPCPGSVN
jgi:signal transduction histidine kinase